jgi:hypothetical protein
MYVREDKVNTHNQCRNTLQRQAGAAGARPELEKGGLLAGLRWPEKPGRRPADTLLSSTAGIRTSRRRTRPKVALDVGIVLPPGRDSSSCSCTRGVGRSERALQDQVRIPRYRA